MEQKADGIACGFYTLIVWNPKLERSDEDERTMTVVGAQVFVFGSCFDAPLQVEVIMRSIFRWSKSSGVLVL